MANDFAMVKQTQIEWCWAAVGATVNNYLLPNLPLKTDCEISSLVTGDQHCCDVVPPDATDIPKPLDLVFSHLKMTGFAVDTKAATVMSFEDIQTQINAGLPVCVRITWFGEYGAHFVVVYGWGISASGDEWVDVGDPFFPDSTILYDSFVNSYQDAGRWTDTYVVKQS